MKLGSTPLQEPEKHGFPGNLTITDKDPNMPKVGREPRIIVLHAGLKMCWIYDRLKF